MSQVVHRAAAVLLFVIFAFPLQEQIEQSSGGEGPALQTLKRHTELRFNDADWKKYSKSITWSDEPSWDCNWAVSRYDIGSPIKEGKTVIIQVVFKRLGLFCYDFDFKSDPKTVKISYQLVRSSSGWKVNSPIPDYPDVSGSVILRSLNAAAGNVNETPERLAEARATARDLAAALGTASASHSPKP